MIFILVLLFWLIFDLSGWWLALAAVIEVAGFVVTFWIGLNSPYTFGLMLVRAFLWPIAWLTSWLDGEPLPMD